MPDKYHQAIIKRKAIEQLLEENNKRPLTSKEKKRLLLVFVKANARKGGIS